MSEVQQLRLNKYLALILGVSRREADEMIEAGRVSVFEEDGKELLATLGERVGMGAKVFVDGKAIADGQEFLYVAMNKPRGYVSSRQAQGEAPTLYELLPEKYKALKTVGRLDKDSSGLILLTNDGDFAHRMTHPSFAKVKVYEVRLDRALEPLHQQMITDYGITLKDGVSKLGLTAMDAGRQRWQVEMSEGKNRQIRRTFGGLGYSVEKLHRIQFGKYALGEIGSGETTVISP